MYSYSYLSLSLSLTLSLSLWGFSGASEKVLLTIASETPPVWLLHIA